MFLLKFLMFIASLFAIYPLSKFIRKDEINIFDFIILFHTLFFCFVPIVSNYSDFQWLKGFLFEEGIIFRVFIFYTIFITCFFITDLFWTKHYKYRNSILNITYYIKTRSQIHVSWFFLFFLFINLIISWVWYLPKASIFDNLQEYSNSQGFVRSPLYLFYGSIFLLCFSFSLILYLKEKLSIKKTNILLIILVGYTLILFFLPRRTLLFYLILSLIIVYSIKRDFFSVKKILMIFVILYIIIKIYFPFYNIMRRSDVKFDSNNFTTSLIHIVEKAKHDFNSKKDAAARSSEGRALNLYYALYRIVKYDKSPNNGELFIIAIDHALPKLINPNKGNGTEVMLQEKMLCKTDQADSILLLAYADFGLFLGAFYAFSLFVLLIWVHCFIHIISISIFNYGSTINILLIINLISISWNVETKLDAYFASLVTLPIMTILLMLLSRFKIVGYKMISLK